MKTFTITFTSDPESGIYSANLINAESAEQATAYFKTLGNYEVVGCTETQSEPKPGQPVHTVPEGWEAPEEEKDPDAEKPEPDIDDYDNPGKEMKNEYAKQAEKFLQDAGATMKIEFQGRAINTMWKEKQPRNLYAVTIKTPRGSYTFDFWDSLHNTETTQTTVERCAIRHFCRLWEDMNHYEQLQVQKELAKMQKEARPDCYDVLACLTKYDPGTFANFCAEYGYDEDSRTAERVYIATQNEFANLKRIFDPEQLEAMQEIE